MPSGNSSTSASRSGSSRRSASNRPRHRTWERRAKATQALSRIGRTSPTRRMPSTAGRAWSTSPGSSAPRPGALVRGAPRRQPQQANGRRPEDEEASRLAEPQPGRNREPPRRLGGGGLPPCPPCAGRRPEPVPLSRAPDVSPAPRTRGLSVADRAAGHDTGRSHRGPGHAPARSGDPCGLSPRASRGHDSGELRRWTPCLARLPGRDDAAHATGTLQLPDVEQQAGAVSAGRAAEPAHRRRAGPCHDRGPRQLLGASARRPRAAPAGDHHPRWASAGARRHHPPQRDRRGHDGGRRARARGSVGRRVPNQRSACGTCTPASKAWRASAAPRAAGRPRSEWGPGGSQPAAGRTPRPAWASAPTSRGADDHSRAPGAARGRRPLPAAGHKAARGDAARARAGRDAARASAGGDAARARGTRAPAKSRKDEDGVLLPMALAGLSLFSGIL